MAEEDGRCRRGVGARFGADFLGERHRGNAGEARQGVARDGVTVGRFEPADADEVAAQASSITAKATSSQQAWTTRMPGSSKRIGNLRKKARWLASSAVGT